MFEAKDFPRHRVCGEFVSAESLDVLAGLLQDVPAAEKLFQTAPVIDRMRLLLGERVIEAPVTPPALSISRYDLDALLWEAARRAGVVTHPNCEVVGSDGDGPFTLQTSSGTFSAKALIVAAGRWSQFTADRTVPPGPKWIGLKAHFQEPWTEPCTDLYFFAQWLLRRATGDAGCGERLCHGPLRPGDFAGRGFQASPKVSATVRRIGARSCSPSVLRR